MYKKFILLAGIIMMVAVAAHSIEITTFTNSVDLDLSGTYDYAVNMGGTWNQAAVTIDNATFVDYRAAGSGVMLDQSSGNANNSPYPDTAPVYIPSDATLSLVTHGYVMTWGGSPSKVGISVGGLTTGLTYEVKMIFSENNYKTANARTFDISVEGSWLLDDFTPIPAEAAWTVAPFMGVMVTHQFVAGDTTLNMDLSQGGIGDGSPYMNAFTLEDLTPPVLLATVSTFTGGDVGEGLGFSNEYVYAVNVAGNAAYPPIIQGVIFTNDALTAGVSVSADSMNQYWGALPYYGESGNDAWLGGNGMMRATATSSGTDSSITVDLDVTAGKTYELQLLFSENEYKTANARVFDIMVEGSLIAERFTPIPAEAAGWTTAPHTGVLVTYEFVASDSVANVVLTNGTSAIIGAVTLEDVTQPIRGTVIIVH